MTGWCRMMECPSRMTGGGGNDGMVQDDGVSIENDRRGRE